MTALGVRQAVCIRLRLRPLKRVAFFNDYGGR